VNLVLFAHNETDQPLARSDRRALHILDVLRRQTGESFDGGLVNGPRGKATVVRIGADVIELSWVWESASPPPEPVTVIVGLTRPQTARDILRDATTLGVGALHFVQTEKSDPNYAQSTLWSSGDWRRHVLAGAEQAFSTRIPEVYFGRPLAPTVVALSADATLVALDNYEATAPLGTLPISANARVVLAIGGERGWSAGDRQTLRDHRFTLASLGPRVLRTETAVVAALALTRSQMGLT
jgi:16S rRNA (uracil1498-N3)-methyltransferase